jgi:hypothetical protein
LSERRLSGKGTAMGESGGRVNADGIDELDAQTGRAVEA